MSEWQPIETATKDRFTEVLLFFPWKDGNGSIFIGLWGFPPEDHPKGGPCWIDPLDADPLGEPSHWMPLPKPPNYTDIKTESER